MLEFERYPGGRLNLRVYKAGQIEKVEGMTYRPNSQTENNAQETYFSLVFSQGCARGELFAKSNQAMTYHRLRTDST